VEREVVGVSCGEALELGQEHRVERSTLQLLS